MDIPEKLKMIELFIDAVKFEIIKKVKDMPEDWDEIELRWYVVDMFKTLATFGSKPTEPAKRLKDYINTKVTKGL